MFVYVYLQHLVIRNHCNVVRLQGRKRGRDLYYHLNIFTYFLSFLHPCSVLSFDALFFCSISLIPPHLPPWFCLFCYKLFIENLICTRLFLLLRNPFPGFLSINFFFQAEKQMKLKMHLLSNKSHSRLQSLMYHCKSLEVKQFVQLYPDAYPSISQCHKSSGQGFF